MSRRNLSGMLLFWIFILAGPGLEEINAQPQKIKLAYVSPSGALSVPWVAKEAGLFEKNGVEAEFIFIRGASIMIQTLLACDIDLAHVAGALAVDANLSGADVVTDRNFLLRCGHAEPQNFRKTMCWPVVTTREPHEKRSGWHLITRFSHSPGRTLISV